MDRPLSRDNSSAGPSTTSGATHKRNVSIKLARKPQGTSVISLFITNLRLLDLDLLPEWPDVVVSSFSNQDARARIKSVEYALYQLFRLYDPISTAEKLQPFFPPLEPLQSVNLRAALFRCLNELKKTGILAKDTVLRKSMLDECQGDKFWEVCLNFSALVLRKVLPEKKARNGRPMAARIGNARTLSASQKESMLPLAIAHKMALVKVLDEKRRKRMTYVSLYNLLSEKDQELRQRKAKSQDPAKKPNELRPENLRAVEQKIEQSWVGSIELKESLITGDTCAKGDGVLVESFDQLWQQGSDKASIVSNGAEVGLLQDLSSKATQQSVRLSMWQSYLDRLVNTKPSHTQPNRPQSGVPEDGFHFGKHRDLNLKAVTSDNDDHHSPQPVRDKSTIRYDDILTAMREELRKNSATQTHSGAKRLSTQILRRAHTQPVPTSKPDSSTVLGAKDPHSRSPSQTAVPFGPRLGRRVSYQPKLYEKPKVDGQREPIPLKSELFSPLKESSRPNTALTFHTSPSRSPANLSVDSSGDDLAPGSEAESLVGNGIRNPGETSELYRKERSSEEVLNNPDGNTAYTTSNDRDVKKPAIINKVQPPMDNSGRPSLMERTRMSIAFNSSDDVSGFLPDVPADPGNTPDTHSFSTSLPSVHGSMPLERTSESTSVGPVSQQKAKMKETSHHRARSSIYPVNQFDTPRKARSSTIGAQDKSKRDTTPIEQLLSPDAEYDSVFRSRPRIALSPVLSPRRDVELDGKDLLEADLSPSSPVARVAERS